METKQSSVSNAFDELHKQYDFASRPFDYSPDYFLWRYTKLKSALASFITQDGKILDVGGGWGQMAQFLPDFVDRTKYYDLDVSTQILKYYVGNKVLAAGENLPFKDNCFDYVISADMLRHITDKTRVLNECRRVLKPGELFLLTTPRTNWIRDYSHSIFLPFLMAEKVTNKIRPPNLSVHVPEGIKDEPSDEKWLKETLENMGFTVLTQFRADNHVPWSGNGQGRFWRWFADRFVNPKKYGNSTIVICRKRINFEIHYAKQSIESVKELNPKLEREIQNFIDSLSEELKTTSLTIEMCRLSNTLVLKRINGQIVGISGVQQGNSLHLCVKKDYWGQGIGTELTDRVIDLQNRRNAIVLSVVVGNERALRIYRKSHFKRLWKHEMSGIAHHRMILPLNWKGWFITLQMMRTDIRVSVMNRFRRAIKRS